MEWSWPESVSSNRQRVMEELVQGRAIANQLPGILRKGDVISVDLVTKILESLTDTLLIMNVSSQECSNDKEELISEVQANGSSTTSVATDGDGDGDGDGGGGGGGGADSSSWDMIDRNTVKSEDWNELNEQSTKTFKDRRGSYKRRKTSHSWTKDTLDLVDYGHAWRKYGQKTILNTKHPRNYFRCTHKFDQSCKATKHTQRRSCVDVVENTPTTYDKVMSSSHLGSKASSIKPNTLRRLKTNHNSFGLHILAITRALII